MSVRELITAFTVNGELLGDRVQQTLGRDIDVTRYVQKERSGTSGLVCGICCSYAYSTHASLGEARLGQAVVYRARRTGTWTEITEGRMKDTLRRLGHVIAGCRCIDSPDLIWRVIAAPATTPLILIREVLFLSAIDAALQHPPCRPMPTFVDHVRPLLSVQLAAQETS